MGRVLAKFILAKLFFVAWFFVSASPLLLVRWLLKDNDKASAASLWVTAPLGIVCFIGSWWLGKTTAHYMVDENRLFIDSIKRTLFDVGLRLAFVPIIGYWFTPDEDMTHYDDDDSFRRRDPNDPE